MVMRKQHYITRRDILTMVNDIHEDLVQLFDCEACSLYFPKENEIEKTTYIKEEKNLLLPLKFKNSSEVLGVFLLRKPNEEKVNNLLPSIENYISMAMEKLYLKKSSLYDQNTNLFSQHTLISSVSAKISEIRDNFTKPTEFHPNPFLSTGAAGLVYFKLTGLKEHAKKYGYFFAENCLQSIAESILNSLDPEVLLARVNEFDLALMLTEDNCDSRQALNNYVHTISNSLSNISFTLPDSALSHTKRVNINVHIGYILFPHDFDNLIAQREPSELAYFLLTQAEYTATRANEQKKNFLPFGSLLQEGGNINKILPHNEIIINLGRNAGLRESMRFSVYSSNILQSNAYNDELFERQGIYKGDISIIEISDDFALAEPSLFHDTAYPFTEGDNLIKLPDDFMSSSYENGELRKENITHLYKHPEFLALFSETRQRITSFSLALLQVDNNSESFNIPIASILSEVMLYFQHTFIPKYQLEQHANDVIFSRYGDNNILCFLPQTHELSSQSLLNAYKELSSELSQHIQRKVFIGVAIHPFLDYKPADALENCKKALECAKLLEFPYVSFCDSVALTISADKLATQGMIYEALQEYQDAILADNNNALAHNSLGVTLVNLNRFSEAQKNFLKALELTPEDISIYYNLGGISEKLGDFHIAKQYYEKCLNSNEYSYFALFRLGLLAESENDFDTAIQYYNKAILLEQAQASPYRQLAKIAMQNNDMPKAREHLYTALRYTPSDAHSLILLAKIYLENNEDPNVISALLSPIMTQRQTNVEAWRIYAQVLKAQGKDYEAANAENKVQNLSI